jgi:hypothetical protein
VTKAEIVGLFNHSLVYFTLAAADATLAGRTLVLAETRTTFDLAAR